MLAAEADVPLAVCWMLTTPDETGEGGRIDYLKQPERYRHLDPHVFDGLAAIVESGERSVAAIEQGGILERAQFFARPVEDHLGSRPVYFSRGLVRARGALARLLRPRHRAPRRKHAKVAEASPSEGFAKALQMGMLCRPERRDSKLSRVQFRTRGDARAFATFRDTCMTH